MLRLPIYINLGDGRIALDPNLLHIIQSANVGVDVQEKPFPQVHFGGSRHEGFQVSDRGIRSIHTLVSRLPFIYQGEELFLQQSKMDAAAWMLSQIMYYRSTPNTKKFNQYLYEVNMFEASISSDEIVNTLKRFAPHNLPVEVVGLLNLIEEWCQVFQISLNEEVELSRLISEIKLSPASTELAAIR